MAASTRTQPSGFRVRGAVGVCGLLLVAGVASAAPASAAGTVTDSFGRTVSGGWGTATSGTPWTVGNASRFAVSGGTGTVSLTTDGVTQRATQPATGTEDDVVVTVSVSKVPTGTGAYISVSPRRTSAGEYAAKVRFLPNGTVSLALTRLSASWSETVIGPEATVAGARAAAAVRVRVQTTGTSPTRLRAKVWQAGSTEPSGWAVTATDGTTGYQTAGGLGLDSYLSRASVPLTARFDDLSATLADSAVVTPPPPPPPVDPPPVDPPPVGPPPVAPPPPPPADPAGRPGVAAGSAPVGTAHYAPPAGALYVSPSGDDTAAGTAAAPWRTVARAIAAAPSGSTVVLRAGTYTESVTIPSGKKLTLQNYPGEEVWLDGSEALTGWAADGAAWRVDGWTATFDHSPTYTAGAPDSTQPNWQFVNPAYPLAAWPEMVFVDGVGLQQVSSRSAVTAGTFYVDTAGHRLYVGSNPAGHEVRATALRTGLTIQGAGSTVRGIGVRRYGDSVPDKGALLSYAPDVTLENLVVDDNATQGIYVGGINGGVRNTLRHVTAEGNGLLGVESSYSDGLVVDGLRAAGNDTEHFNVFPVSGGMKITRARGLTVVNSLFADNLGNGLWFDESSYDMTITGDDVLRNAGDGLTVEISAKAVIANDLVAANGGNGVKIDNTSQVDVWNNTVLDNVSREFWIVQDSRLAKNLSTPGHDPRQALPDPTVTWLLGPVAVRDNVIGGRTTQQWCVLCFQDSELYRTATQMGLSADGNLYYRPSASSPPHWVTWPVGQRDPRVYSTLAAFRAVEGQELHGAEYTGAPVVDGAYRLTGDAAAGQAAVARPLPAAIAGLLGVPAGTQRLGAFVD